MKLLPISAACTAVALVLAGCGTVSQDSVVGGSDGSPTWSVVAQPANQGQALITAINSAQKSVDIVVYQIGSPDVTAALVSAMQRGVAVRLILDGYNNFNASFNKASAQAIYQAAQAAGVKNPPLSANYSSENFNITHQKTAIIDAAGGGTPTAVVSTGNFADFQGSPYYHSRDFYATTQDPNLVGQIATVFNSDFRCDGRTVTNNLRTSNPLIWSNGTTQLNEGDPAGAYPLRTPTADQPYFGYFDFDHQNPPEGASDPWPVVQGGSMATQLGVINAAQSGDILRIYNEEQNSKQINQALSKAVGRGVDVRIVESYETPPASSKIPNLIALATTAPNGARANVMAPDSVKGSLYVHAKVVSLQPANGSPMQAYVGSSNFSNPSMNDNRELGVLLAANDQAAITTMNQTFDTDFGINDPNLAYMITYQNKGAGIPASWAKKSTPDLDAPKEPGPKSSDPTPNVSACGPIPGVIPTPTPTTPAPSPTTTTTSAAPSVPAVKPTSASASASASASKN